MSDHLGSSVFFWSLWAHLGSSGKSLGGVWEVSGIWDHLGSLGVIWLIWAHLGSSEIMGSLWEVSGRSWRSLGRLMGSGRLQAAPGIPKRPRKQLLHTSELKCKSSCYGFVEGKCHQVMQIAAFAICRIHNQVGTRIQAPLTNTARTLQAKAV